MANLIRGLSENGGVVFCGVDSTDIVRKAEKLHTTSATCSAALGRLLTGATLMGSMLKDDRDRITLRVEMCIRDSHHQRAAQVRPQDRRRRGGKRGGDRHHAGGTAGPPHRQAGLPQPH